MSKCQYCGQRAVVDICRECEDIISKRGKPPISHLIVAAVVAAIIAAISVVVIVNSLPDSVVMELNEAVK